MKERPIVFSGPEVRAILEGRKTQTRRVVKKYGNIWRFPHQGEVRVSFMCDEGIGWTCSETEFLAHCPYGVPGDRLWVRETWAGMRYVDARNCQRTEYVYRADHGPDSVLPDAESDARFDRWRPSIHMPRKASRLTLEVVAVRVERLQAVSNADAIAEGFGRLYNRKGVVLEMCRVWDETYGKSAWAENPWVWRVEFKRVEA